MSVGACPFCRCADVRVLFASDDGLHSYTCHACQRTFHVTERGNGAEPQADAPAAPDGEAEERRDTQHRKVR